MIKTKLANYDQPKAVFRGSNVRKLIFDTENKKVISDCPYSKHHQELYIFMNCMEIT